MPIFKVILTWVWTPTPFDDDSDDDDDEKKEKAEEKKGCNRRKWKKDELQKNLVG